jgi:ankyrin repeat protein
MFTRESRENNEIVRIIKRNLDWLNDQDTSGYTDLHKLVLSTAYNAPACIRKLIKLGANVNLPNAEGFTPLMTAVANNSVLTSNPGTFPILTP